MVAPPSKTRYNLDLALRRLMPSTNDIACATTDGPLPMREADSWPPHIKQLNGRIDLAAVRALPGSPETLDKFNIACRYLTDPSIYAEHVPPIKARQVQRARFPPRFTAPLVEAGHVELVEDLSLVRGSFFGFATPEPHKSRWRLIQDTQRINQMMPAAPRVTFRSIAERAQCVHKGSAAVSVDLTACYPQIPLSPEVRNWFCARLPSQDPSSGRITWSVYRLCVGPTGMAHMPFIAVALMERLKDFSRRSTYHDDHIDNVLFVGTPGDVEHDLREFGERCRACNVAINEDLADPTALITTCLDWCGQRLDFERKTVALTSKVVEKTRLSWENRDRWTWRGFAGHMGCLFYAMQVLDIPVCEYFEALRFVSKVGFMMQAARDTRWDERADVGNAVWPPLATWTALVLRNEPRFVRKDVAPNVFVLTDASRHGWGYIALDTHDHRRSFYYHGEPWDRAFVERYGERLHQSVFTETQASLAMKRHLLPRLNGPRSFLVGTDNVTNSAVLRYGFSCRSFQLNEAARHDRRINAQHDQHQWRYVYVPGCLNVFADALSRGKKIVFDEVEVGEMVKSLRRLLGASTEDPSLIDGGGIDAMFGHHHSPSP